MPGDTDITVLIRPRGSGNMSHGPREIAFVYSFNNHHSKPKPLDLEASKNARASRAYNGRSGRTLSGGEVESSGLPCLIKPGVAEN